MATKTLRFLMALFTVVGAYFAYAHFAVPLIEGNAIRKQPKLNETASASPPIENKRVLQNLIEPTSWVHQKCKVIETQHGLVLFQKFKRLEDGSLEVKPFTLISVDRKSAELKTDRLLASLQKTESQNGEFASANREELLNAELTRSAILMESPDGAVLNFAESSATGSFDFGKLNGGQLPGEVKIRRRESTPGALDNLFLRAFNVTIENSTITSPHTVNFQFGKSKGAGRNLILKLFSNSPDKETASFDGIESLELKQLEQLYLETPSRKSKDVMLTATEDRWTKVKAFCDGSFKMNFLKANASFARNVQIIRLNEKAANDELSCELLELIFDKPFFERDTRQTQSRYTNPKASPQTSPNPKEHKESPQLERVIARGKPAVIKLPSKLATAKGTFLQYDIKTRKVHLKDPNKVSLDDAQHSMSASEIQYTLGENGRVGTGWAIGGGQIRKAPDAKQDGFIATWQSEMNIRPHDGKIAVSLYDGANIRVGKTDSFSSNELHFWLHQIQQKKNPYADLQLDGAKQSKNRYKYFPAQLLATGNVTLNSAQAVGTIQTLKVFWPELSAQQTDDSQPNDSANELFANQENRQSTQSKAQPKGVFQLAKSKKKSPAAKQIRRWKIDGNAATIHLLDKKHLKQLVCNGGVKIEEQLLDTLGNPLKDLTLEEESLQISGKELTVKPTTDPDLFEISVSGSPAKIDGRGQTATGTLIMLDQPSNEMHIPGAGQLVLQQRIKRQKSRTFQAKQTPQKTTITWNDNLLFDGVTASFNGNIEVDGFTTDQNGDTHKINAKTDKMLVRFDRKIDFQKISKLRDRNGNTNTNQRQPSGKISPQFEACELAGRSVIVNQTLSPGGRLKSVERLELENVAINYRTGKIVSPSSGKIQSTRIDDSANAAHIQYRKPGQISFFEINFDGGVEGNLFERDLEFKRNVRTIYGPVPNWQTKLDLTGPITDPNSIAISCDALRLGQWKSGPDKGKVEINAAGNTIIVGANFKSNANSVRYVQAKDLMILQGTSRNKAKLWYTPTVNASNQYAEATQVRYWRSSGQVQADEVGKAELSTDKPLRIQQRSQPNSPTNRLRGR